MSGKAATIDQTRATRLTDGVGNKGDTAASGGDATTSILAYLKGLQPVEANGDADIDISESDYTAAPVPLLTITPASGSPLHDVQVRLDMAKATTGFDAVATAADTIDVFVQRKIDGTAWRAGLAAVRRTAGSLGNVQAVELDLGPVGPTEEVRVAVLLSAERADAEIPYRVVYKGAAPTITAVAAG